MPPTDHTSAVAGPPDDPEETQRFLRLAQFSVDRGADAVFWISPTGLILYVNDAACRILGYTRQELVGNTIAGIDPNFPAEKWPSHWAEVKARGSFSFESDHWTKDGCLLRTEVTVNFIQHEGREYNCAIMRDITARRRTETQLHRKLEQLEALNTLTETLNNSTDLEAMLDAAMRGFEQGLGVERMAVLIRDGDGVNRFRAWRGLSDAYRRSVEGHTFWSADDPNPQPVLVADVQTDPAADAFRPLVVQEGIGALVAVPLVVKNRMVGKCMLYFDAPRQFPAADVRLAQSIAGHVAFAVERALSETEIWTSENLLQAIVDSTTEAVFVKDAAGRYVSFNRAAARFVGRPQEEVIGLDDAALFNPESARTIMEVDRRLMSEVRTITFEETLTSGDGVERIFGSTKGPLFDRDGKVRGVFGIARDITDVKRAQAQQLRSEARFRALIQHSSDIITVVAPDSTIQYQSPAFFRLLGWSESDVMGRKALDLVHPEDRDRVRGALAAVVQSPGAIETVELRFMKADGSYLPLEAVGNNQLDDPDIAGVVVNSRDVTERRRFEERLRQAEKMEALGRLAGGVAHDFNNLLTVIEGYSEAVLHEPALDYSLREPIGEIRRAAERAAKLTSQLLAFGRRRIFSPTALDITKTVQSLAAMLRRLIGEDVRLDLQLVSPGGFIRMDAGQLEQVVMNLVINARDAMPAGGLLVIRSAFSADGNQVVLTVRDTGCGMPPETLARVFEPFFTTKAVGRGTGLGLASVYGVVRHHGGTIDITSKVGVGTTVVVSFPRVEAPAVHEEPSRQPSATGRGVETVLLVEDEEMVRKLVHRDLVRRGYRVLEAPSGDAALERFAGSAEPIHLLLTDVVMPGISGRVLADRLGVARPGMKVIFMSGYTDGAAFGDDGMRCLQKPFTPDLLDRVIRETLDPATTS